VHIVIGRTTKINGDDSLNKSPYATPIKKKKGERRANKQDRRKSVRDGVIVSLSFKNDRRVRKDRRKKI
jgi:hypothetical protein